ncbi:hypothetical protein [Nitratireductor sp. CH_MIT9313-5]|uniref:hypothetical protein n=1 Tax=Nitratireductor sp. CH_MIT9313-5 TaxID=3107764 RepID=UPI003009B4A7
MCRQFRRAFASAAPDDHLKIVVPGPGGEEAKRSLKGYKWPQETAAYDKSQSLLLRQDWGRKAAVSDNSISSFIAFSANKATGEAKLARFSNQSFLNRAGFTGG